MRIIESEWSRNPKEKEISVAGVIQGTNDFKLGFELDRMFAHYDMFEGYRATRKYGYRGKASPSDAYKPPFWILTLFYRQRSGSLVKTGAVFQRQIFSLGSRDPV